MDSPFLFKRGQTQTESLPNFHPHGRASRQTGEVDAAELRSVVADRRSVMNQLDHILANQRVGNGQERAHERLHVTTQAGITRRKNERVQQVLRSRRSCAFEKGGRRYIQNLRDFGQAADAKAKLASFMQAEVAERDTKALGDIALRHAHLSTPHHNSAPKKQVKGGGRFA